MRIEDFIKLNNFKNLCREKKIAVREDGDYMLLKYEPLADFNDPIVRQARGVIFKDGNVVCRPFDKFCNYGEEAADDIDWDSARVQEKIDGNLIKLWYDDGMWRWSTMGMIDAAKADSGDKFFLQIIQEADNYSDIPFEKLDIESTYLFELIGPDSRVVIDYPKTHLYHIGTRKNSGKEWNDDIGIEKPREFNIHSLSDCIKAAEALNPDEKVVNEGYVVVDKDYHRIKVKSPEYILLHRAINNGVVTVHRILRAIQNGTDDVYYNSDLTRIKYLQVKYVLAKLEYEFECDMQSARLILEEFDYDRKRAAVEIDKLKYPFAAYAGLGNDLKAKDFIKFSMETTRKIEKLVKAEVGEEPDSEAENDS